MTSGSAGRGEDTVDPSAARCHSTASLATTTTRTAIGIGLRSPGLRQVQIDDATVALRLLVDRRDELGQGPTEIVNRVHQLLLGKQDPCGTVVPRLTNDEPADQPDDCGCGGDHPQKTGGAARGGHASLYVGLTRWGHVPDLRTEAADTPNATVATARTDYRRQKGRHRDWLPSSTYAGRQRRADAKIRQPTGDNPR